ncbi:hypothetical protein X975_09869, partial [Stegodyphus mimosarum]
MYSCLVLPSYQHRNAHRCIHCAIVFGLDGSMKEMQSQKTRSTSTYYRVHRSTCIKIKRWWTHNQPLWAFCRKLWMLQYLAE